MRLQACRHVGRTVCTASSSGLQNGGPPCTNPSDPTLRCLPATTKLPWFDHGAREVAWLRLLLAGLFVQHDQDQDLRTALQAVSFHLNAKRGARHCTGQSKCPPALLKGLSLAAGIVPSASPPFRQRKRNYSDHQHPDLSQHTKGMALNTSGIYNLSDGLESPPCSNQTYLELVSGQVQKMTNGHGASRRRTQQFRAASSSLHSRHSVRLCQPCIHGALQSQTACSCLQAPRCRLSLHRGL